MAGQKDTPLQPKGHQQITALSSATALTVPSGARFAFLQAQTADVRWRDDGVDPTASVGMILPFTGSPMVWYTGQLSKLRFISATGGINVAYYA